MFDFTDKKMNKAEAEHEAHNMLANMITEMILSSDSVPEEQKIGVRIVNKARCISNSLHDDIVKKYAYPNNLPDKNTLNKVLEYLELVELGIKQFVETTPFVAKTEEE